LEDVLMKIGVMADTHDRLPAIAELLRRFAEEGVAVVLHAGDYCAPFALDPFITAQLPMAGVFGRNDGDVEGLRAAAQTAMGIELFESPHSFKLGEHSILLVHDIGEVHERSLAQHAFVFHGTTHQQEMKTRGDTLIINPGEACGWVNGAPTAAVVDLDSKHVEFIKLDGPQWGNT
jgi:putative phosphoesterase